MVTASYFTISDKVPDAEQFVNLSKFLHPIEVSHGPAAHSFFIHQKQSVDPEPFYASFGNIVIKYDDGRIEISTEEVVEREDRPEMMSEGGMLLKARMLVWENFYDHRADLLEMGITRKDVYVVWFSKTLQNWKALVSTNVKDDMYYEVTYNGDKAESYIDQYQKVRNVRIADKEI